MFSFSVSINSLVEIKIINYFFYVLFHLTFIYLVFYYYHYFLYILAFIYGVLFDILLLNEISSHLLSFILLISIYILFKKYLFLLSSYQISITILIVLIIMLIFEGILAYFISNIYLTSYQIIMYLTISIIIFIPSVFLFNKFDK